MFHLLLTPTNRYRFYDDVSGYYGLATYPTIISAYTAFPMISAPFLHIPPYHVIASSPDYASFHQLYPEFFI